jgi:hypothetical protein
MPSTYGFNPNLYFDADVVKSHYRVELDVINYALAVNGSTVTASSTLSSSYPVDAIIDGDRTHRNWGGAVRNSVTKYGGWQSNGSGEEYVIIDFGAARSINRMELFFYPKSTRIGNAGSGSIAKQFSIYYQAEGSSDWVLWSGLESADEATSDLPVYHSENYHDEFYLGGGGTAAISISNGTVYGNTLSKVALQDLAGLDNVRKIKVVLTEPITAGTKYRICEIEIYKTYDITEYVSHLSINRRKDIYFNRYVMAQLDMTLLNMDKRFSPRYTPTVAEVAADYFNSEIRPDMRCRVYLGLDRSGWTSTVPAGYFYTCSWKGSSGTKLIKVLGKDRIKYLNSKDIEVENSILTGQYLEYLIEYLALQANVSADELLLDDTYVDTQYFFPESGTKVWTEQQKLAEAVANISLFMNRNGVLEYHSFLESIPHEWTQNTRAEFEAGSLSNVAVYDFTDILSLPTRKHETVFDNAEILTNLTAAAGIIMKENTLASQTSYGTGYLVATYRQVMNSVSSVKYISGVDLLAKSMGYASTVALTLRINGVDSATYTVAFPYTDSAYHWVHIEVPRKAINPGDTWELLFTTLSYPLYFAASVGATYNNGGYIGPSGWTLINGDFAFAVYDSYNTATYVSKEYDSGCADDIYAWAAFTASVVPDGCSVTLSIGTYTATGTLWAAIPGGQTQVITNGATPTIARKRFIKVRVDIDATGIVGRSSVASHTINFALSGIWTSQVKDLGIAPESWGVFSPRQTLPGGTGISYQTQTSADNITWEVWQNVDSEFKIYSTLNRYIKARALPLTADGSITPQLDSITVYYNTGTGSPRRKESMPFALTYDSNIFNLEHSISDEYSGANALYTRVIVKTSPYFLQNTEKVWEANVPFNLLNGVEQRFDCELADPCDVGANMKLYLNAYTFTGGSESQVDMDVVFTKNPRIITIVITPKADVTVTSMYIDAKPYRKTGVIQSISEASDALKAQYGLRDYTYENEYIYVKATADVIAIDIREKFQTAKVMIEDGMAIQFCPGLDLEYLVRITDAHSGIAALYEIIGYTHTCDKDGKSRTAVQAMEVV